MVSQYSEEKDENFKKRERDQGQRKESNPKITGISKKENTRIRSNRQRQYWRKKIWTNNFY